MIMSIDSTTTGFLDGIGLGTAIVLIIGIAGIIFGLYTLIEKYRKARNKVDDLKDQIAQNSESIIVLKATDEVIQNQLQNVVDSLSDMTTSVNTLIKQSQTVTDEQQNIKKDVQTLMTAHQSTMRNDLLNDYRKYMAAGKISDSQLLEWVNRYNSYHSLGKNGVLDSRYTELLELSKNSISEE